MILLSVCGILLASALASAQKTTFVSVSDSELTIKNIALCPIVDNVKGIYSVPLKDHVEKILSAGRRWQVSHCDSKVKSTLEDFEENPDAVKAVMKSTQTDAVLAGRISRGPSGLSLRFGLFLGKEGLPWSIVSVVEPNLFEINDVKTAVQILMEKVVASIPYEALVLSRRGQLVTIDQGSLNGMKPGQELQIVQVVQVNRHPKFKFVTGIEKSIMGTIRLQKVDETLSFGSVMTERSEGLIAAGFKAVSEKFVRYQETPLTSDGKLQEALAQRKDRDVSLGENPEEWKSPKEEDPAFGAVSVLFGLGTYSLSNSLSTNGGVSGSSSISPSLHFNTEFWITANWIAQLDIIQTAASVSNELSSSTPSKLNVQTRELQLGGAYRFWFGEGLQAPTLDLSLGMNQMSSYVDDSTPVAFTSPAFGGLYFGISGAVPVDWQGDQKLMLGAKFNYVMNATLAESPKDSGSANSTQISQFALFAKVPWKTRLQWLTELRFHQYGATMNGAIGTRGEAASSLSHSSMSLAAGVAYLF